MGPNGGYEITHQGGRKLRWPLVSLAAPTPGRISPGLCGRGLTAPVVNFVPRSRRRA